MEGKYTNLILLLTFSVIHSPDQRQIMLTGPLYSSSPTTAAAASQHSSISFDFRRNAILKKKNEIYIKKPRLFLFYTLVHGPQSLNDKRIRWDDQPDSGLGPNQTGRGHFSLNPKILFSSIYAYLPYTMRNEWKIDVCASFVLIVSFFLSLILFG